MTKTGFVTLVGAGPGDPGLLTLAGKRALERAEVVLYDRLVGDRVLALVPDGALAIDVGKRSGEHPVPQDEINTLIVRHAEAGKRVVRLKGGDPYLFGRGAEELEQVREREIPFRVIPGVTSAVAVPAYAGIPVTHRDFSSSLHILTGHAKAGSAPDIPYRELARLGGTLVFLMGLAAAADICGGLVAAGMSGDTPAAAIENGTRPDQRALTATLDTLPDEARRRGLSSPALLVIGDVCSLAEKFDWSAHLPLWGKRALTASSTTTASRLAEGLRDLGCAVDEFHAISRERTSPPDDFWRSLAGYTWIVLTSPFGAEAFLDGLRDKAIDIRGLAGARFAAVGARTAETLAARAGLFADMVPAVHSGKALGDELAGRLSADDRVLLFRAEAGDRELADVLRRRGAAVDDVSAYATTPNRPDESILDRARRGGYDAVAFTSASSAAALAGALDRETAAGIPAYCIGDMTAAAAAEFGVRGKTAPEASIPAMVRMIAEDLERAGPTHGERDRRNAPRDERIG